MLEWNKGPDRFRQQLEIVKGDPHGTAKDHKQLNANYDVVAEAEAILAEANLVTV